MHFKFLRKISLLMLSVVFFTAVNAQDFQKTARGIKSQVQSMDVSIEFYAPGIVRVFKSPEGLNPRKESLSVIKSPEQVQVNISSQQDLANLKTNMLWVEYNTVTGRVSFRKPDGDLLFTEKDYGSQFSPFNDAGNATYTVRQAFLLDKDEAIYGLGQQQVAQLNQRNHQHFMRQRALLASVPIIQSPKGYGMFWDNCSPTTYNDNPQEMSFESQVGDCIDYYFMYGGNADGVIAQIRDLTGQAPMFPLWTFGFFQSRERYQSQEETMEVVDTYRKLGVPLDCVIQDWQYWGPNTNWNSMNFDNPKFPDPQKMIDHIHSQNAKIMISIWASFGPDTEQYKELKEIDGLLEFTTWPESAYSVWPPDLSKLSGVRVYDAYSEKARDIYWKHLNKGLFSKGIDAWWTDSTEPDQDRKSVV